MFNSFKKHGQSILGSMDPERSLAVDVFRGLTITLMILVNNPGSWSYVYWPLAHAEWHGWTPTDLVFPFFIFIVGMALSFKKVTKEESQLTLVLEAFNRGAKLFLIGLAIALFYYDFLNPAYDWWQEKFFTIRVMGVLQRIGLVFFFSATLIYFSRPRGIVLWMIGLLIFYSGLMIFMPYQLPDGSVAMGLWEKGNNFAASIDHFILGRDHVYAGGNQPFSYDPEGLLTTLPSISSCLAGYLTGLYLKADSEAAKKVKTLFYAGIVLTMAAYGLSLYIPINKALWTPSYVVLTTGLALATLASLIYILDMKKARLWSAPFIVFGANALLFYVFSMIFARILVIIPFKGRELQEVYYTDYLAPIFGNYAASLVFALLFLCFSYGLFYLLYKRQIFWKV
ncbi:hypothetical protein QGN29_06820 [Temperatibacter marinus]|uniref:Heparan-alpha-glucosaminide N-acetyltransferase catalytic domain-containing protein n=1 Tax=Temperatibacter marinus TaxID=1456591 RepID=A0AA52HBT4_9PROT|nr:hypothetical protein [Temperatibacter marinus]WND04085.1 hypothetical protein QGN29_06820 [Temperatibacter marinus]